MICPLCGQRKARRSCPGVGQQICTVCCGTKRLVEILCPPDCVYLTTAREHPPAPVVRQQQRDVSLLVQAMRDFSERQSELFLVLNTFLLGYQGPALQPLIDDDVIDAVESLGSTFETASRGVIYEHRAPSAPAERLAAALKPIVAEAGQGRGSSFERDAAAVLRQIAATARTAREADPGNRRAYLDVILRTIRKPDAAREAGAPDAPRLILP